MWSLAHNELGALVHGVTRLIGQCPDFQLWQDLAIAM